MSVTFRIRRDSAATWTSVNPVLALGEPALETDTRKTKYGDGVTAWNTLPYAGSVGTVTSVSVTTANGVSGTVSTATTTPAISLSLGAITPSSVAAAGTVTGSNLSGTNTGDQTTITGNAGSATVLQTARNINGVSFNGSANITVPAVDTATPRLAAASNLSDLANKETARSNFRNSCKAGITTTLSGNDFSAGYTIPWNTEVWDDASWHDNSTNPERLTVPTGVDRVKFTGGVRLTGLTAAKVVQVQILKNAGATVVTSQNGYSDGTTLFITLSGTDSCTAGDYYVMKITQTSGTVSGNVAASGAVQFVAEAI